ncbi:MAG: thiol-disulfide oxidoreductase DCC family protein [Bacteroidales bacterium]
MGNLPEHIVIFDGVCNFCNASVNFILKQNKKKNLYFSDLQSPIIQDLLKKAPEDIRNSDSILFYSKGKWYNKSAAVLQIAKHLRFPYNKAVIFQFIPEKLRDAIYNLIARNRYQWFGKKTSCKIPTKEEKKRMLENFL